MWMTPRPTAPSNRTVRRYLTLAAVRQEVGVPPRLRGPYGLLSSDLPANLTCVEPDNFHSAFLCQTYHPRRSAGNVIVTLFEQRGQHSASRMPFPRALQLPLVIPQPDVSGT